MSGARAIFLLGVAAGIGAVIIRLTAADPFTSRVPVADRDTDFTDLNDAGREELEKLGLDTVAVDRIVENRPYRNKLELVSRMIIPESLYGDIRHRIGIRDTTPELSEHPRVA
jgi:hypothetical protein